MQGSGSRNDERGDGWDGNLGGLVGGGGSVSVVSFVFIFLLIWSCFYCFAFEIVYWAGMRGNAMK